MPFGVAPTETKDWAWERADGGKSARSLFQGRGWFLHGGLLIGMGISFFNTNFRTHVPWERMKFMFNLGDCGSFPQLPQVVAILPDFFYNMETWRPNLASINGALGATNSCPLPVARNSCWGGLNWEGKTCLWFVCLGVCLCILFVLFFLFLFFGGTMLFFFTHVFVCCLRGSGGAN